MNTSCEFISEPPMVEKTEEKKSKNEERKNETILPPIQLTGTTPKTPRIHRGDQWFLEVNDNAEEVAQPLPVPRQ